jgi:voltage-gated potassium channel
MSQHDSKHLDEQAQSLARAAGLIVLVLAIGVVGYKIIGGDEYGVLDAIYMTVITLTTVGYGEVIDLNNNPGGRIFTIALLVLGAGIFVYFFSSLTAFIVDGNLDRILWRRRMRRALNVLDKHYIICGGGRTGRHMIRELLETDRPFVLVDIDETSARALADELEREFPIVVGDATDDDVLRLAGIERALGLCVSTSVDKDNLLVIMTARMIRPDLRIVASCNEPRAMQKLQRAGADAVVSPNVIGGLRLVSELVRPDAVSFLDTMLRDKEKRLRIEEVALREGSAAVGRTLGALRRDPIAGLLIIAVRETRSDSWTFNPSDEFRLVAGLAIVFMSSPEGRIIAQQRWAEALGHSTSQSARPEGRR